MYVPPHPISLFLDTPSSSSVLESLGVGGGPVGVGGRRGIQNGGWWGGQERGHRVGDKLRLRGWALSGDMGLVCQGPLPGQLYLGEVEKQQTVDDYGTVGSGGARFPWDLDPSESRVVRELEQEWKGWEMLTTQPQLCPLQAEAWAAVLDVFLQGLGQEPGCWDILRPGFHHLETPKQSS